MSNEIDSPIINTPYEEPLMHWHIYKNTDAKKVNERRPASYFYNNLSQPNENTEAEIELDEVNRIRQKTNKWYRLAKKGRGGATRVTQMLLNHWKRKDRCTKLFYAQFEAALTIIFLNEARQDFLQGIKIPVDKPAHSTDKNFLGLTRYCCRMATGTGKTTVMGMIAAWSILNKVADPKNLKYSDSILVICPNITIRDRLSELDPRLGDASIYNKLDLVPEYYMSDLKRGKLFVTNWHVLEPHVTSRRMLKKGVPTKVYETIRIRETSASARNVRYMSVNELERQIKLGDITVRSEKRDKNTNELISVQVERTKYFESDTGFVNRILKPFGSKSNIIVFNDEAHHAYRLQNDDAIDVDDQEIDTDLYLRQATVWVDGLDKINRVKTNNHSQGINQCIDFTATPYFLQRSGSNANRIFPWTVSSFGLQDAIEAGLVKIPQLPVRDSDNELSPAYYNIWHWIRHQLTTSEKGGKKSEPNPNVVLKYAHTPMALIFSEWEKTRIEWLNDDDKLRPPVLIIVCKTTNLAKTIYKWLAEDSPPSNEIPSAQMPSLLNTKGVVNTLRVDSKVCGEVESENSLDDDSRWMRRQLDTIGKVKWEESNGKSLYPDGYEELVNKLALKDPSYLKFLSQPPGKDIRCIISVGMLTEGWDCNTVTHIIGLRPFMSQLLCEQVIGRGLRRESYILEDGKDTFSEEVSTILGVPLTTFPIKGTESKDKKGKVKLHRIYAMPTRSHLRIVYPRVESYVQYINNEVSGDIEAMPSLVIGEETYPVEVDVKAGLPDNTGVLSLPGPGKEYLMTLEEYRRQFRIQKAFFDVTRVLTSHFTRLHDIISVNRLFYQIYSIVSNYVNHKVVISSNSQISDVFLSPTYTKLIEILQEGITPSSTSPKPEELPSYELNRKEGSTSDVDYMTRREPVSVNNSHVNAVVPDSKLERETAFYLDKNKDIFSFVKNAGLGFAIPYLYNGEKHDYLPDFIVHLKNETKLILETKGFDDSMEDYKSKAADRWVRAVNAEGSYGIWKYALIRNSSDVHDCINKVISDGEDEV